MNDYNCKYMYNYLTYRCIQESDVVSDVVYHSVESTYYVLYKSEGMMSQEKKSILRPTVYSSVAWATSCTVVLPGQ